MLRARDLEVVKLAGRIARRTLAPALCLLNHREHHHVIVGYSNRTHRWRCFKCKREWDD
jgi:transposase-like protein